MKKQLLIIFILVQASTWTFAQQGTFETLQLTNLSGVVIANEDADATAVTGTEGQILRITSGSIVFDDSDGLSAYTPTDNNFLVGNGSAWVLESGNVARTSLGLGTGDSPSFDGLTINSLSFDNDDINSTGPLEFRPTGNFFVNAAGYFFDIYSSSVWLHAFEGADTRMLNVASTGQVGVQAIPSISSFTFDSTDPNGGELTITEGGVAHTVDLDSRYYTTGAVSGETTFVHKGVGFTGGAIVFVKRIDLPAWDMDTDPSGGISVAHSLGEWENIMEVSVTIENDANNQHYSLERAGTISWDGTNVNLDRTASGIFDAPAFSGAISSRGTIMIIYWIEG